MRQPTLRLSGLYLISDTGISRGQGHAEIARAGIRGGARVIQLRDKALPARELYQVALKLRELTREAGVLFIVNDVVELAMAVGADGVHLGQDDFPVKDARRLLRADSIIGVSTHSMEEAVMAEADGADYIGFGPIFATSTKDAGEPKGLEGLMSIRDRIGIPIAAIGGINAANAKGVIEAGADAVAVISAVSGAEDVEKAAREISRLFL